MATAKTYQRGALPLFAFYRTQSIRTISPRKLLFQAFPAYFASRDTEGLCINFAITIDFAFGSGSFLISALNKILSSTISENTILDIKRNHV